VDDLTRFSDGLAAAVEAASPSVVRVDARRRWPGSGIVWAAEGVVVTADHIIEREEHIEVGLPDGTRRPASLVGRDPTTDLAVIRTQASGLTAPTWADPDGLRVGHVLLALGRPGQSVRAAFGILSALGETWRAPAGGDIDRYIQVDLRLPPGFSGGPLADTSGRVRGLATSGLLREAGVAVPWPTLRRVVDTLLAYGRVRRGYLGVRAHPVRLPDALAQQSGQDVGLVVIAVEPGSPAESGGLLLGDVLLTVGGQPVLRLDDLMAALRADRVGATLPVRIARGGQIEERRVVVGERAA
jgi:S1-C subfamily serine protease